MSDESMVTVGTFPDATTAYLAKGKLEEAGIACFIAEENSAGWILGLPTSWPKIQVFESDALRAIAVLEGEFGDEPEGDAFAEPPAEGVTTRQGVTPPGRAEPPPESDFPDEAEEPASRVEVEDRSAVAERAFKAALVGVVFCPVTFYALYLLMEVWERRGTLTDRARRRAWVAAALCVAQLAWVGAYFLFIVRR